MFSEKELVRNSGYWLDQIQNEVYFLLKSYMEQNDLNQKGLAEKLKVSPSYVSQVLNGNFNHSILKLIDLALAIDKVPKIEFINIEEELVDRKKKSRAKVIDLKQEITVHKEKKSDLLKYV